MSGSSPSRTLQSSSPGLCQQTSAPPLIYSILAELLPSGGRASPAQLYLLRPGSAQSAGPFGNRERQFKIYAACNTGCRVRIMSRRSLRDFLQNFFNKDSGPSRRTTGTGNTYFGFSR